MPEDPAISSLCWRNQVLLLILLCFLPSASLAVSAKELLAAGKVDEAIRILQLETSRPIADAQSFNWLCRAYFMIDEWDRGIPQCERARDLDPNNSLYELWLGRIYGEKADRAGFFTAAGLARKVRNSFERAVELDPASSAARTDLGEFDAEAPGIIGGGKDRARAQAAALMPIDPARAHWLLARIAEKDNDPAAAEREYRAAIAASHSEARSWQDLASFLFHRRRLDEMEQAIRSLESSPLEHPEALMYAGGLLLRAERDYPLAMRLLRRYLASPVEEAPAFKAHELLGQLLEKRGDRPGAAAEFRAALALFRNYARAQEDLRRVEP
ncbi:MAG: tetratricopeptide repeat protein [Candidatus Sulfotelmatobacter sp.]